jgi:hypothetical protein
MGRSISDYFKGTRPLDNMDTEVPNEEAHPEKGPSEEVQLDFSSLFEENGAGLIRFTLVRKMMLTTLP